MGQAVIKISTAVGLAFTAAPAGPLSGYALVQAALNSIGNSPSLGAAQGAWPLSTPNANTACGISVISPAVGLIPCLPDSAVITSALAVHVWTGATYRGVLARDASLSAAGVTFDAPAVPIRHVLIDAMASDVAPFIPDNLVSTANGVDKDSAQTFSTKFPPQAFNGVQPFKAISFGAVFSDFAPIDIDSILTAGYDRIVVEGRMSAIVSINFNPIYTDNAQDAFTDAYICASALDRMGLIGSASAATPQMACHGIATAPPQNPGSPASLVAPMTALKNNPLETADLTVNAAAGLSGYVGNGTSAYPCSIKTAINMGTDPNLVATQSNVTVFDSTAFPGFAY